MTIQRVQNEAVDRRLAGFTPDTLLSAVLVPLMLELTDRPHEFAVEDPGYPNRIAGNRPFLPLFLIAPDERRAWAYYLYGPPLGQLLITDHLVPHGFADQLLLHAHGNGVPVHVTQFALRTSPGNWLARLARYNEQF